MWFHWVGGQETRWFDGVEQGRLVEVPSYLLPSLLQNSGKGSLLFPKNFSSYGSFTYKTFL